MARPFKSFTQLNPNAKHINHDVLITHMLGGLCNENGHLRYPRADVEQIVELYLNAIIHGLGTGRPVVVKHLFLLQVGTKPPKHKPQGAADRARKKYYFELTRDFTFTEHGLNRVKDAVLLYNHVVDGEMVPKGVTE